MSTLEENVRKLLLKSASMEEAMEELRKDTAALEVRLLMQLEELKKAFDDIFRLQERVISDQSEIASLRAQIIREHTKRLKKVGAPRTQY